MSYSQPTGGIYIASRTRHAQKWIDARASGLPITCTWIDEAGPGESVSPDETHPMVHLWQRCIDEASAASALIVYREDDEPLKGALVEVGAALGAWRLVCAVGFNGPDDMRDFSFLYHKLVIRCIDLETAFAYAIGMVKP